MKQFVFEQKQKNVFIGLMIIGLVSMFWTFTHDDGAHTRFWTNFIQNAAFFTGIGFIATFAIAASIMTYSGWYTAFKRVWESISLFLIVGIVLMGIVFFSAWGHLNDIYHWANPALVKGDKILIGKSSFLNLGWYAAATFGFISVWYLFARKFRAFSLEQDKSPKDITYPFYTKAKVWGAAFLPIGAFTSAAAIWQWLMSIDAHWYSTMFAWYTTASWFVSMIAITILLLIYFKSKGYFHQVTIEHLHDLGKFLFAFSIFWTYLWFSQYMLIWYANIGEETIYFKQRMGEFPALFYGNLLMNFVLPFLILMRNDTKRKFGSLGFAAALVLFGHWIDFFQMVKVGPCEYAHLAHIGSSIPGAGEPISQAAMKEGEGHAVKTAAHVAETAGVAVSKVAVPAAKHGAEGTMTTAAKTDAAAAAPVAEGAAKAVAKVAEVTGTEGATKEAAKGAEEVTDILQAGNYFHYYPSTTAGFAFPSIPEFGTLCFFVGLFLYFVFNQLTKASLVPENDAFLEETLHHHVEIHGEAH